MRSFLPKDSPLINALKCCANCNKEGKPFTLKMCPECRLAHYCNDDCQQADRENHQHQCNQDTVELKEQKEWLKKSNEENTDNDDDNVDELLDDCPLCFLPFPIGYMGRLYNKLKEQKEWLKNNHNRENTDNDDDNDDTLFQSIPPKEDCPLCFIPLPITEINGIRYMACCGNSICHGCFVENTRVTLERRLVPSCAFCREPTPTSNTEYVIRIMKRMEMNDSEAIFIASKYYKSGEYGLSTDTQKAFELSLRAAKLLHAKACNDAALFYVDGVVVAKDMTKARKYYEMAAKKGNIFSRYNLGVNEWNKCNYNTAGRHWLISAAAGDADSLVEIAELYQFQLVTKEEYSIALTSYRNVHKNEWSIERERAAAAPRFHC